jgi:hypothetical protein
LTLGGVRPNLSWEECRSGTSNSDFKERHARRAVVKEKDVTDLEIQGLRGRVHKTATERRGPYGRRSEE